MRKALLIVGSLAILSGIGLVVARAPVYPAYAYTGGGLAALAGTVHIFAGWKNYRGDWSFIIGVGLLAFGLWGLAMTICVDHNTRKELIVGIAVPLVIAAMGILSLWSGQKLHRYAIALEAMNSVIVPVLRKDQVVCAQCRGVFEINNTIPHGNFRVCAQCKPIFLQKLAEGANVEEKIGRPGIEDGIE